MKRKRGFERDRSFMTDFLKIPLDFLWFGLEDYASDLVGGDKMSYVDSVGGRELGSYGANITNFQSWIT